MALTPLRHAATRVAAWAKKQNTAPDPDDPRTLAIELSQAYAEKLRARDAALSRFPPYDEAIGNMRRTLDDTARHEGQERVYGLLSSLAGKIELGNDGEFRLVQPQMYFTPLALTFKDLATFAPDALKRSIEGIFREFYQTLDREQIGLPLGERLAAYARATEELQAIEEEHTTLVDTAAALTPPVVLELLPPVAERRQEAARHASRNAELAAHRAAHEALVNERLQPETERRIGQSEYLAAQSGRLQD